MPPPLPLSPPLLLLLLLKAPAVVSSFILTVPPPPPQVLLLTLPLLLPVIELAEVLLLHARLPSLSPLLAPPPLLIVTESLPLERDKLWHLLLPLTSRRICFLARWYLLFFL